MNHTPQHHSRPGYSGAFVLVLIGLACLGTWAAMEHNKNKALMALTDTLDARFEKLGNAYQARGHVAKADEITALVKQSMGPELAKEIRKQGGAIVATVQAQGTVQGQVSEALPIPTVPSLEGTFTGTAMQDRGGLPPLTKAIFQFAPSTGLKVAWDNQTEKFKLNFASWRTSGDGLRAAAKLTREVNGATEEISLTGADAYFPASEVTRITPLTKGDVGFGPFLDQRTGRTRPLIFTSKRWDRRWSTAAIFIPNTGYAVIGTYSWGVK